MEQRIETGPTDIASVFARAFELGMQIERERFLEAGHYERTPERRGYANGTKPKRVDTPAGTVNAQVPKMAGHDGEPFSPQSLQRGRRSVTAVMLAVAEMYIKYLALDARYERMRHGGIVREAVGPGRATWQRCQVQLAGNAIHHTPNARPASRSASR